LLFIIVVYCIFTVFRREVERKRSFARIHYSLLMIISVFLMRGLDREGSSSALFATSWSNRETGEGEAIPRRARHRQRQFQVSKAPAGTNKDKPYVLQIFIPNKQDYLISLSIG
jgi:hypothetical protein